MMALEEVVERIWKEDPNGGSDAAYYATAEFLPGLPDLSRDEQEHRRAFTAAVLCLLSNQETMKLLAECAPRKKNGLFHKGRVFKIGLTGLADKYSNELLEIVGKSKDETTLVISVTSRRTSPDELDAWTHDFISTYHEGLPISEAMKTIFEKSGIEAESRVIKPKKVKADFYDGLGDGTQEIDTAGLENKDYLQGIRPKHKKKAEDALKQISAYLVDPDTINWDGMHVNIDTKRKRTFR